MKFVDDDDDNILRQKKARAGTCFETFLWFKYFAAAVGREIWRKDSKRKD